MMVKPWAKAIAAIPGRPTLSPTTAAAPAPMNTNAKVPMNSARSLGAREFDIAEFDIVDLHKRAWRRSARRAECRGLRPAVELQATGKAGGVTPRRSSAA